MTGESVEDYYDQRWTSEPKANLWAMHRAAVILKELSELDIHGPRILDFGCGTGWLTKILSQFGAAEGIDLAPAAARRFHPDLVFNDVSYVPEQPFDVVVSQEVIEHADEQIDYVDKAHAALRPGGYLILTTPNAAVSLRNPQFLIQPVEKHLTSAELRRLLSQRFKVLKLYSFFYGYAPGWPHRVQMRFGRFLNSGLHLAAVCMR
jgi:2-polyprenyl-3-methyl-5-hydroxy-6-metoxy-1,4-benzoquinol methylase